MSEAKKDESDLGALLCCPKCGETHEEMEKYIFTPQNKTGGSYFYRCDNPSCTDLIRFKVTVHAT